MITILFTVFLDLLGFGILIPVIPLLLADPSSSYYLLPMGTPSSTGYLILGLLLTAYPLAQFFSAPILGQLSDRFGRKPVLLISLLGTAFSYLLFAIGIHLHHLPLLFIGRILDGITGGNISVAQAAISDITPPALRARNFGLIGMVFGLGFIIGPFLGGKLSDPTVLKSFDSATPFWFAFILALINATLVLWRFQETHPAPNSQLKIEFTKSVSHVVKAFQLPKFKVLFSVSFLQQAGFSFFTTFFSVFLIRRFAFNQGQIGDIFAYIGLWVAFTQGFLTRRLSFLKEYQILRVAMVGNALSIFMFFLPQQSFWLYFIIPIFSIQNGLVTANLLGLISRSGNQDNQGEILGINASLQALGQGIPPLLSGLLASRLDPSFPTLASALVLLCSAVIFNLFYRPNPAK